LSLRAHLIQGAALRNLHAITFLAEAVEELLNEVKLQSMQIKVSQIEN
jgi:hypothetical protein